MELPRRTHTGVFLFKHPKSRGHTYHEERVMKNL